VTQRPFFGKEAFTGIAEESGLEMNPSHLEDVYTYLLALVPTLKADRDLDLTDFEPFMPSLIQTEKSWKLKAKS